MSPTVFVQLWPFVIILLLAAAGLAWWFIPKLLAADRTFKSSDARRDFEDSIRANITRALSGFTVAIGILITIWQSRHADQLASETRILDQYQKATENLAASDRKMHSGAAASLVATACRRPELQRGAVDQLAQAAVVYSLSPPLPEPIPSEPTCSKNADQPLLTPDSQAALTTIADRPFHRNQDYLISLRDGYYRGASIPEAYLINTDLGGGDLAGSDLYAARLHQTNLRHVNLNGASLPGADLSDAGLEGASLCPGLNYAVQSKWGKMEPVDLNGAALFSVDVSKASFDEALLVSTMLWDVYGDRPSFRHATLCGANFQGANLSSAYFDNSFSKYTSFGTTVKERAARLEEASFKGATLVDVSFASVDLKHVHFDDATLIRVDFTGASLDLNALSKANILCSVRGPDGQPVADKGLCQEPAAPEVCKSVVAAAAEYRRPKEMRTLDDDPTCAAGG